MKPQITNSFPPLSEADMQQAEKRLGFKLPKSYRTFLLETNGGYPEPDNFETETSAGTSDIFISGISLVDSEQGPTNLLTHFTSQVNGYHSLSGKHSKLLSIASDFFGNQIYISYEGEDRGAIYLWIHDDPTMTDEYENLLLDKLDFIASDFEEFINSFIFDPDLEDEEDDD